MAKKAYERRPTPLPPSQRDENGNRILQPYIPVVGLTKDKLKGLMPKGTSAVVTDEVLTLINNMENDTGLPQDTLEGEVESYMHIMASGGTSLKDYVNAVKFCTLKRHYDVADAWSKVFPDRAHRLIEMGQEDAIPRHAYAFSTTKVATAIDKEMLIPAYLQYAPYYHAAIKKQFELLNGRSSSGANVTPMVEHLAAKELALLTAQPQEMTLNVTTSPSDAALSVQEEMNAQLKSLVSIQRDKLVAGEDITDVQVIGLDFAEVGMDRE